MDFLLEIQNKLFEEFMDNAIPKEAFRKILPEE